MLGVKANKLPDGTWTLNQSQYIEAIMAQFEIKNLKTVDIPLQPNLGLTTELIDEIDYSDTWF